MGPALLNRYPVPIASMAEITHQEVRLRFLCAALKLWRAARDAFFKNSNWGIALPTPYLFGYRRTALVAELPSHFAGPRQTVGLSHFK